MKKSVVIVAHKYVTQPDDELVKYLNDQSADNVIHIRHSFSDAPDRKSYYTWFRNGKLVKEEYTRDFKGLPEPLLYLKELYFTALWLFRTHVVWDLYIGMDGLCVVFGFVSKFFSRIKRIIFWGIDFVPENRFKSVLKNKIYESINVWGYKHANEMWDLSPRMAEAREKFLGIKKSDYKLHRIIPYGVWTAEIKRYPYDESEKHTLVFMGHLIEKQGVQLVIKALPLIQKTIPDIKLKIVGGGSYMQKLEELAKSLDVADKCSFLGKIPDHNVLQREIATSCVAFAPYIKELDTWTYYADPGKVKEYIACGVPLLLTDIPWNATEIQSYGCGKIITTDLENIASSCIEVMNPETNKKMRENCATYAETFNYKTIFDTLFKDENL